MDGWVDIQEKFELLAIYGSELSMMDLSYESSANAGDPT